MAAFLKVTIAVVCAIGLGAFLAAKIFPPVERVQVSALDDLAPITAQPMPQVPKRDTPVAPAAATPTPAPSPTPTVTESATVTPEPVEPLPEVDVTNILVVGSDLRRGDGNTGYGSFEGQRSDSTMLVQINPHAEQTTVVSIPRDLWVNLPNCAGGGQAKFNAAYDFGGLDCLVKMTQDLTGVKLHHVVIFDFNAFKEMIDVVGGVTVCVNSNIYDSYTHLELVAGENRLDSEQALAFARSRHSTSDGSDLSRIERQQYLVKRLLAEARQANLGAVDATRMAQSLLPYLTVDQNLDVGTMAVLGVNALGDRVSMSTLPYYFSDAIPWGSVAFDAQAAEPLLETLRNPPASPTARISGTRGPRALACVN